MIPITLGHFFGRERLDRKRCVGELRQQTKTGDQAKQRVFQGEEGREVEGNLTRYMRNCAPTAGAPRASGLFTSDYEQPALVDA